MALAFAITILMVAFLLTERRRVEATVQRMCNYVFSSRYGLLAVCALAANLCTVIFIALLACIVSIGQYFISFWGFASIQPGPFGLEVTFLCLAFIVPWRSVVDAKRVLSGVQSLKRPIIEGACIGFAIPQLSAILDLSPLVYAGIPLYAEAQMWSHMEWYSFILGVFWASGQSTFLGAMAGFVAGKLNRLIVLRTADCSAGK